MKTCVIEIILLNFSLESRIFAQLCHETPPAELKEVVIEKISPTYYWDKIDNIKAYILTRHNKLEYISRADLHTFQEWFQHALLLEDDKHEHIYHLITIPDPTLSLIKVGLHEIDDDNYYDICIRGYPLITRRSSKATIIGWDMSSGIGGYIYFPSQEDMIMVESFETHRYILRSSMIYTLNKLLVGEGHYSPYTKCNRIQIDKIQDIPFIDINESMKLFDAIPDDNKYHQIAFHLDDNQFFSRQWYPIEY
jgi:hypothetical protein